MSDYKNLNLNRESLDQEISVFLEKNGYSSANGIVCHDKYKRVVFVGGNGPSATVDLFLNKNGTTTVHFKTGQNHNLGEELAVHLKSTINPSEFESVNFSVEGIPLETFEVILELIREQSDINVSTLHVDATRKSVRLQNTIHHDTLTLTCHFGTRVLQIQGRPLICYGRLLYCLTTVLDLKGLERVLHRTDNARPAIVSTDVANNYLQACLPVSYNDLPREIRTLLVSSCCIKLAAPQLPDYSLLLYPDLRSLEGVLKMKMAEVEMSVANAKEGFGDFFYKNSTWSLKKVYADRINNPELVTAFSQAYGFYNRQRHALFHMDEFQGASKMSPDFNQVKALSEDVYRLIEGIYAARV